MTSPSSYTLPRFNFARAKETAPLPNLIDLQKTSYDDFLQKDVDPHKRKKQGLQEIFEDFFPVKDFAGTAQLEFSHYVLEEPKYDATEARVRGTTHAAPLRVTFRLVVWDVDSDSDSRSVRHIKEQNVYMGDIPLMTDKATFVINGVERVVVSQMHRSPGVFFDHDRGRTHVSGKFLFSASVRPARGSWFDVEFDGKDLLYVRIDRKRKFLASTLLMALPTESKKDDYFTPEGMSREEILTTFYEAYTYYLDGKDGQLAMDFVPSMWRGHKLTKPLVDADSGKVLLEKGKKITKAVLKTLAKTKRVHTALEDLLDRYLAQDCVNPKTGEVYAEAGDTITDELYEKLVKDGVTSISVLQIDHITTGSYLRDTLAADRHNSRQEALFDIYRLLRPGDPPTFEAASDLFYGSFFDPDRYDLSPVGRMKTSARLKTEMSEDKCVLTREDLLSIIRVMLDLRDSKGSVDDIDSLANRRVRAVGEMLAGQYQAGLLRLERSIKERMSNVEKDELMPQAVLNAKPLTAVLRDFFGSSQLSQFMDQTNPLSELTHKRRLSALGPGGLAKDRASIEVRDVHPTHYGRVCPVETPEGQSIGLINSMACYARVNRYGFMETPYARVQDGRVTDEVVYLSAIDEGNYYIAQGNAPLDDKDLFTEDMVSCRKEGEYVLVKPSEVDFIDISPKQILSVAASLIPFVENDDASRALMGANMQRQAVPLLLPQAPLVGTGLESVVARDSGSTVVAKQAGVVSYVDAARVVVVSDPKDMEAAQAKATKDDTTTPEAKDKTPSNVTIYPFLKFQKTNHGTCFNQRPLVAVGDRVEAGQIIADGPATDRGELALGHNVTVAFMLWHGYGFEDSIIVSERLVQDDAYTSVHIDEFEISARDTKLGSEEITRDIPGVSEEQLRRLDESGIVYTGAEVKAGDILVGKVTPKGDNPMTSEEKLLRAIFGEKAVDMRDTSLKLPPGVRGTVIDVRVFSRRGLEKDERSVAIERQEVQKLTRERDLEKEILERGVATRIKTLLEGCKLKAALGKLEKGAELTKELLAPMTFQSLEKVSVADTKVTTQLKDMVTQLKGRLSDVDQLFEKRIERLCRGDDLPSGVLKTVRVFVAIKRKLQTGDKMAGRHGNKGVVSRILPVEDMPHLADGTPVDMVLNPLGVPSRMNVGQVLETHLGWAAKGLGKKVRRYLESLSQKETPDLKDMKAFLGDLYKKASDNKKVRKVIEDLSEEETLSWTMGLSKGLPMKAPVFEGAKATEINHALKDADLDTSGQVTLYDGRTGLPFDRKVTVGVMYMIKLHHLVDEKIHARSVGPYSLITQQPLGGKAQFGGQRLGEMEVWALQGYGAAHALREMLTIKSDDTEGRTSAYESIIRGDNRFQSGVPASFNVLVKELRALGLNVEFLNQNALEDAPSEDEDLSNA